MVNSPASTASHFAAAHFHSAGHPVIRSYEPGENRYWGYVDPFAFELGATPAVPSHP